MLNYVNRCFYANVQLNWNIRVILANIVHTNNDFTTHLILLFSSSFISFARPITSRILATSSGDKWLKSGSGGSMGEGIRMEPSEDLLPAREPYE